MTVLQRRHHRLTAAAGRADAGLRVYDADSIFAAYEVMASTIADLHASDGAYADVLAHPFLEQPPHRQEPKTPDSHTRQLCPMTVTSTGRACSLTNDHQGHCRHLAHRKTPPQ